MFHLKECLLSRFRPCRHNLVSATPIATDGAFCGGLKRMNSQIGKRHLTLRSQLRAQPARDRISFAKDRCRMSCRIMSVMQIFYNSHNKVQIKDRTRRRSQPCVKPNPPSTSGMKEKARRSWSDKDLTNHLKPAT